MVIIKERIEPIWYRKISAEYLVEIPTKKCGVYVFFIGDYFYIGISHCIRKRISRHVSKINDGILSKRHNISKILESSYEKTVQKLIENPEIIKVEVELLEECCSREIALISEKEWIKAVLHMGFHDYLLNKEIFTAYVDTWIDVYKEGFMDEHLLYLEHCKLSTPTLANYE